MAILFVNIGKDTRNYSKTAHIIIRLVQAINLRSGRALDDVPPKMRVPKEVFELLAFQPEVGAENKGEEHMQEIEVRPPPPLPERLQKLKDDSKYKTFLDILSQCSARVQSKLPPKLKDPGCFNIVLEIGKHEVGRALCDLGASINLLPLSMFKQLNLGVPRPTTITLQLVDRSLVVPEGIIKDVLVRIVKFIFLADFIILGYLADEEVPIILGQPFMATGGALIDVREVKLKIRVHDEEITFNVYKALNLPRNYEVLCMISMLELKLIEQGLNMEPSSMEKKIELEEVCCELNF
nr:uncharacterized protein LOC104104604 [Nicotiana tomentosiformis]